MTTTRRGSTGNQGVSGPHPLKRSVYRENRGNVEKSSPDYEELCNYGIITETAACILTEVLL